MQYVLIFKETEAKFAERDDPAKAGSYWGAWNAYIGALQAAGVMTSGNGLQPPHTGTTVRVRDGVRHVQDGPHPDSKEQLGGYVVIDVPNLDAALEWAARSPSSTDAETEVRPVLPPMS
ncbi:MAG: YciI family protein [Hyphomicrobiaceae bacterium]|nr:YciI family protein [Hyphomicrobiaceae bacterium]